MGQLEESKELTLDFTKLEKVGRQVSDTRAAGDAGLVTMPGTFTPTEMVAAHEAGADYIKVFPVRALGPAYVKDVLAPLHLRVELPRPE